MKKSLLSLAALAAAASCGAVWAEDAAAPAAAAPASAAATPAPAAEASSPLSFNIGLVSLYKYRGQDQYFTGSEHYSRPALQGGVDYAFSNGLYLGNWNSIVSSGAGFPDGNLEMDFYGGYKASVGDFGVDVGGILYYYPGSDGETLDAAGVKALASIPSREELLAKLLGVMMAPLSGMAVCLGALAKKREEEGAAA